MSVVSPGGGSYDHQPNPSRSPVPTKSKATLVVIVVAIVLVVVLPGGGDLLFTLVVAPLLGCGIGAIRGFVVGFGVLSNFPSCIFLTPIAIAGILGALGGAVTAWLARVFELKSQLARSFVSTLFSPEIWKVNVIAFLGKLVLGAVVGYVVSAGFSSIGVFDAATTSVEAMAVNVLGGGAGAGLELFSWLVLLFAMLAALLVTAGMIGAGAGGIVGAIIGAGFSSIGVNGVIQGAAEGSMFRLLAPYRPSDLRSGRFSYFIVGALTGAGESIFVGAGVGLVLGVARVVGIIV